MEARATRSMDSTSARRATKPERRRTITTSSTMGRASAMRSGFGPRREATSPPGKAPPDWTPTPFPPTRSTPQRSRWRRWTCTCGQRPAGGTPSRRGSSRPILRRRLRLTLATWTTFMIWNRPTTESASTRALTATRRKLRKRREGPLPSQGASRSWRPLRASLT